MFSIIDRLAHSSSNTLSAEVSQTIIYAHN